MGQQDIDNNFMRIKDAFENFKTRLYNGYNQKEQLCLVMSEIFTNAQKCVHKQ